MAVVFYLYLLGGLALVALCSWFIWDKRYGHGDGMGVPPGYEKTDEVFLDPVKGKKLRVYYNAKTGERFYGNED